MTYDEFQEFVRELCLRDELTSHGLLPIPALRRQCEARLRAAEFDAFLVRLHAEGKLHLLSHVEFEQLPPAVQREALHLPSGQVLYWIRCL